MVDLTCYNQLGLYMLQFKENFSIDFALFIGCITNGFKYKVPISITVEICVVGVWVLNPPDFVYYFDTKST
jgi:hypothetical protein